MDKNKSYTGIDYFIFIAAFFIIAIHTSPLLSFSETGDFMLTRIVARVAVPFFFMTSGFFLITRYHKNIDKLKSFIKKTGIAYGIAIIIYIPFNIYNGYFKMDNLLPNIIKDIFFFLLVSTLSAAFAVLATLLFYKMRSRYANPVIGGKDRAWLEVDLNNLRHNVKVLKKAMPTDCELMAVVKAEAYGHGAFEISTYINRLGVKAFAVATIDEGIELRRYGIVGEILILGFTNPERANELHKYKLIQTLIDYDYTRLLNKQGYKIKAHMKVNTGMHRLGFDAADTKAMIKAFAMKYIEICGIYTHLCVSDSVAAEDIEFTNKQIQCFYTSLDSLKGNGFQIPKTHIQSSYGFLNYPELKCSYVRAGVSLYGVLSSPYDKTNLQLDLRPVLSLKSQIILLRRIERGASVGYGRAFVAEEDSQIAILPIGYADGFPRSLSCENGEVLIRGKRAPIIGRICMDQLAVDVTDLDIVSVGDVVTLIGKDGNDELYAATVANHSDSITNELLSRMGARLKIITKS